MIDPHGKISKQICSAFYAREILFGLPRFHSSIMIPPMRTIIGFGASSMQGVGDSGGGFFNRIATKLSAVHQDMKFVNCGIGGQGVREMLLRARPVCDVSPHEIIVMLGCNELPRARDSRPEARIPLDVYTANLDQLLGQIKGQHSLFISSFAVCPRRTGVEPGLFDTYMAQALQLARRHKYDIWDLYQQTKDDVAQYWAKDGLHFNDAGHQLVAHEVVTWIESRP